jgi:hypothetical protein
MGGDLNFYGSVVRSGGTAAKRLRRLGEQRFFDDGQQVVGIAAFADVLVDVSKHIIAEVAISGVEDDGRIGADLLHGSGDLVAIHAGHEEVEQHQVAVAIAEDMEALRSGGGRENLVAGLLEEHLSYLKSYFIVIDAKYCGHDTGGGSERFASRMYLDAS